MGFSSKQHALVLVLAVSAVLTTPDAGGAVYWATLIAGLLLTLYALVYAGDKAYTTIARAIGSVV